LKEIDDLGMLHIAFFNHNGAQLFPFFHFLLICKTGLQLIDRNKLRVQQDLTDFFTAFQGETIVELPLGEDEIGRIFRPADHQLA